MPSPSTSVHSQPAPLAALLALALLAAPATAGDGGKIGWSELDYRASKLGFSLEARVEIHELSQAELSRALVDPGPGEWLPAPAAGGWRIRLESSGLGRRSDLDLLLDADGGSLQRTQVETGRRPKDHRDRTQRFSRRAVHVGTTRPGDDELGKTPADWSERSEWLFEIPEGLPADAVLGQSTGLFYTLAVADLTRPGDRTVAYVLGKGRVTEVELTVEAWELVQVDFVEVDAAGAARRRDQGLPTIRVRLGGRELGEDAGRSDFRFLGLGGDVHVFLDPATRAPVLITGDVGWLGRAQVKLQRLVKAGA